MYFDLRLHIGGHSAARIFGALAPGWDGVMPKLLSYRAESWSAHALATENADLRESYEKERAFGASCRFGDWLLKETRCYSYALGDRQATLLRACGRPYVGALAGLSLNPGSTVADIAAAAEKDGLRATGDSIRIEPGFRPVALFHGRDRSCGWDYHWIRLDRNGDRLLWSCKFPGSAPRFLAAADPREIGFRFDADRVVANPGGGAKDGIYNFVSFFNVPETLAVSAAGIERGRSKVGADEPWRFHKWDRHLKKAGYLPARAVPVAQLG